MPSKSKRPKGIVVDLSNPGRREQPSDSVAGHATQEPVTPADVAALSRKTAAALGLGGGPFDALKYADISGTAVNVTGGHVDRHLLPRAATAASGGIPISLGQNGYGVQYDVLREVEKLMDAWRGTDPSKRRQGPTFAERALASGLGLGGSDIQEALEAPRRENRERKEREVRNTKLLEDIRDYLKRQSEAMERLSSRVQELEIDVARMKSGAPGQPSSMHLVRAELKRRIESHALEHGVTSQARVLHEWLVRQHPDVPHPTQRTIENAIRDMFREAKREQAGKR